VARPSGLQTGRRGVLLSSVDDLLFLAEADLKKIKFALVHAPSGAFFVGRDREAGTTLGAVEQMFGAVEQVRRAGCCD
jgi:hypothetical protein